LSFIEIIIVALALSMDAGAVSLAASAAGYAANKRAVFRLSFHFGLFQFLMPVLGWIIGATIEPLMASFDHWIAFVLLGFVAVRMIRAAFDTAETRQADDPSRGLTLVMLSVATSIDALAVGLSLAMLNVGVWYASAVIGVVTMAVCLTAIFVGGRVGAWLGRRAQLIGGVILLLIAARIVISHIN
jgi:manganese efflux pump family protein